MCHVLTSYIRSVTNAHSVSGLFACTIAELLHLGTAHLGVWFNVSYTLVIQNTLISFDTVKVVIFARVHFRG